MASTIPNIAKGRMNQLARDVAAGSGGDPAFVVVALQDTGLESLAVLRDHDTLAAILAAANVEVTAVGYSRIVLINTDVSNPTVDDTGDEQTFDVGDHDFGALASGQSIQAAVIGYRPLAASPDADIIPVHITRLDAAVATNGETFHWRTPNGLWAASEPA